MINLTFLAAQMPLVKQFLLNETRNYPLARRFTSVTYEVSPNQEGLELFYGYLKEHGAKGDCFYKGELKREISLESRAGLTLTSKDTQVLVIDIDKFEMDNIPKTFNEERFKELSETVIQYLPTDLHNVSYIAQASSSLGTKPNTVSMHFFFFLDKPVSPQMLKWWLCSLNLTLPKFEAKVTLSPTGHALQYPIDRCMAENSRIIYIAPPEFDKKIKNPFPKDTDRFIYVAKKKVLAPLAKKIGEVIPQLVEADLTTKIEKLRADRGLPKQKAKVKVMKTGPSQENQVLLNPDKAVIQYAYHNDTFCYANLNNGDSNAYYWPLDNPKWVHNFKSEPVFEMAKVDSEFYKWYMEEFREYVVKDARLKPLVFRDFATDAYYTVEYDPSDETLKRFTTAGRNSLKDFMAQYWEPLPDPIPTWDVFFNPQIQGGIDFEAQNLNLFAPTPYMVDEVDIPAEYKGVGYGEALDAMKEYTPNISKLIMHMIGEGEVEFEHFINWLAYVFVYREKTNIAWIFHGVEGTGKGLFYTQVIQKLFGKQYSVMKRITDLEDKFDAWKRYNLITVIDEFRLADTTQQSRMYDQIKNMISEPFGTIRMMRTDPIEFPLYSNYMFFSNNEDAMKISASDRRFCLGVRQVSKIDMAYNIPKLMDGIEAELHKLAVFLREFDIDVHQARVALENEAKASMRAASNSWVDDFSIALQKGNFSFFFDAVMFQEATQSDEAILISKCRETVAQWLLDHLQGATNIIQVNAEDARLIYSLIAGRDARPAEFGKVLSRRGLVAPRFRHNGRLGRWIQVEFDFGDYDPIQLIKDYGSPAQRQQVGMYEPH